MILNFFLKVEKVELDLYRKGELEIGQEESEDTDVVAKKPEEGTGFSKYKKSILF